MIDDAGRVLARATAPTSYYFSAAAGADSATRFDGVERVLAQGINDICVQAGIATEDIERTFFGLPGYGEASADIAALDPEVREHDPLRALDGGADGLDAYRIIAAQTPDLLLPGGLAGLEVGQGQAADVAGLLAAAGLELAGVFRDLGGVERCVLGRKRS